MKKLDRLWNNLLIELNQYNLLKNNANDKSNITNNPYVSIVIPCVVEHFTDDNIKLCLDSIFQGTIIPNEIIIVISDITKKDFELKWTKMNKYTFYNNFKFLYMSKRMCCGESRQTGLDLVSKNSEILIFCDADDVYHRQRVEIIIYFFRKYDIKILNHLFIPDTYNFQDYDIRRIEILQSSDSIYNYYFPDNIYKTFHDHPDKYYGEFLKKTTTDGHMAIRLPIDIKFKNITKGCDSDFLYRSCYKYKKNLIIGACLSKYSKALDWIKREKNKRLELYNSISDCEPYTIKYI